MTTPDLNALAQRIHAQNHQWWHDLETGKRLDRNKGELLMLVVSELSEALEGERKDLMDDHLPHRKMAEVEMADAVIRLLDFAGGFGVEFFGNCALSTDIIPENKGTTLLWIVSVVLNVALRDLHYIRPAISACEAYCAKHGYDLWGALEEKLAYNQRRADHKREARLGPNGKKF